MNASDPARTPDSPLLVVGLGNPGPRYEGTRHNLGFAVVDELASRLPQAHFAAHKRSGALVAEARALGPGGRPGRKVVLAKPGSYMNLSGRPVRQLADFFHVTPADVVIAHDELELHLGEVRMRRGGGDHGHNGLRSVTKALGTKDYTRLSCGIGRPPGRMDPADFVLRPFAKKERDEVPIIAADAADLVEKLL